MTRDFEHPGVADGHVYAALSQAVSQATDPMDVLSRIVAQALVLVPNADGATVELAEADELVYVCCSGSLADHVGTRLGIADSFSGLAVTSNQVLCCDDSESDPRVNLEACRKVGATSMVCVPLRRSDGAIGVLKVASKRPWAFDERDIAALERLAPFLTTTVAAASDLSKVVPEMLDFSEAYGALGAAASSDVLDKAQAGALTQFVANVIRPGMIDDVDARHTVAAALQDEALSVVVQPIFRLDTKQLFGAEALARFAGPPVHPPDLWFTEAHRVGLGVQLELMAARHALDLLPQLPPGAHLAVNVGPAAAADPNLSELLDAVDASRVVLELTEHVEIDDYPTLRRALSSYRHRGVKLAADDTGAGVSGLTHILRLAPDYIKLDRELTQSIELDPVRRSLASALVAFASESGAQVVAEGIETEEALRVLTDLGVTYGQGYHLGRPVRIEQLSSFLTPAVPPSRFGLGPMALAGARRRHRQPSSRARGR